MASSLLKPFPNILAPGTFQVPASGGLAIDWLHPLTRGLTACYVPGVTHGQDLVEGRAPTLTEQASDVFTVNPEGPALKGTTSFSGMTFVIGNSAVYADFNAFSEISLYFRGYSFGAPAVGDPIMFGMQFDNAGGSPFQVFSIVVVGTTNYGVQWNNAGSFHSSNIIATTSGMIGLGATGKAGGNTVGYFNGVNKFSTGFGAGAPSNSATTAINIGAVPFDATRSMNNAVNICIAWNRQLTDAEMAWIHSDPYAFIIPAEYDLPEMLTPEIVTFPFISFDSITRKFEPVGY